MRTDAPHPDLPDGSRPRPHPAAPRPAAIGRGSDRIAQIDPDDVDPRHLRIGDATEIITRPWNPRRTRYAWLIGAGAALVMAGVVTIAAPAETPPPSAAVLHADAVGIETAIGAAAAAARSRVDALAGTPVLRAAVLTDAATLHDLVTSEIQLATAPGEMLVIDQLRGDQRATLLRLPATAPPLAPIAAGELRLEPGIAGGLAVVAAAPIAPYATGAGGKKSRTAAATISGVIAISVPVDLSLAISRLHQHAVEATLIGAGQPIALMPRAGAGGTAIDVEVRPASATATALGLRVTPPATGAAWKNPLRFTCCGLSLAMLLVFVGWRRFA